MIIFNDDIKVYSNTENKRRSLILWNYYSSSYCCSDSNKYGLGISRSSVESYSHKLNYITSITGYSLSVSMNQTSSYITNKYRINYSNILYGESLKKYKENIIEEILE
jgi:hypothetical protein